MCNPTAQVSPSSDPESPTPATDDGAPPRLHLQAPPEESGSSLYGAIFNFTNCIVGAGAIGLGGAFADSGGLISMATIVFFAFLTKLSLDVVVIMSVENSIESSNHTEQRRSASYEELGNLAFGKAGLWIVSLSKFLYSFGCLVAYIIVVKDNFTPALRHFIYGNAGPSDSWFNQFLLQDGANDTVTWILGVSVILPLCLLRDMTPLSNLGAISIGAMICIVLIVIAVYFVDPDVRREGASTYENWFEIRPGFVER
jgi:solute carrier family 38 (sodium-coupled neutral amino acid transporter), member 11